MKFRTGGFFLVSSVLAWMPSTLAECPSFVKKDFTVGNQAEVPPGWFVYSDCGVDHTGATGLYLSRNDAFDPEVIAGTQADGPCDMDITDDGKWILYLSAQSGKLYLIQPNGGAKTEVPTPGCTSAGPFSGSPRGGGFYRHGPRGLEVFYLSDWNELKAVQVNLDGSTPSFGTDRTIANLSGSGKFADYGFAVDINVNGSHIYSQMMLPSPYVRAKVFLTIPDDGAGTATFADQWQYTNLPNYSIFGCGFSMSPDGTRIASGYGTQGDDQCVPCHNNGGDHKGFVVERFREPGDTRVGIDDLLTYGLSVNWCPEDYRFGSYNNVDFSRWYWSNNDSLIVGTLAGSLAQDPGVWLVDWVTNTWTLLTTGNLQLYAAAIFFEGGVDARIYAHLPPHPSAGARLENGTAKVYDIRGRLVARMVSREMHLDAALPAGAYVASRSDATRRIVVYHQGR